MYTIYHNPRCSKSRQTLELLKKNNIDPEIILYLDNPPSIVELKKNIKTSKLKTYSIYQNKGTRF